jgi:hypothetical protein
MMFLVEMINHDPIGQTWKPEVRAHYINFSEQLMHSRPLLFKIGKGGMSYYLPFDGAQIFVCHFNATPRSNRDDLGFADFRYDALRQYLNVEATLQALSQGAPPEVEVKPHKLWCSLQFPLTSIDPVADLFRERIILKIVGEGQMQPHPNPSP